MKRYKIISELGKGATGVVYRAVRTEDGETVALKKLVLPGHLDAREEEEFIARFKREAEAALSIDHPGVVKALDCGLDEGTFYIAYELVDGFTLEEAIGAGRKFSAREVADILLQASEALGYAHEIGVIHRDISPGNIFLTSDGKVKIADFGVARFKSQAAGSDDAIVGTPGYMAPEQVTGGQADQRADIFALGCVGYTLLAGQPAFKGDSIAKIVHQVLHVQPPAISETDPKVPLALEEVIFRMLAKNVNYRYQSMAEVRAALSRVADSVLPGRSERSDGVVAHSPCLVIVDGPDRGAVFELLPSVTMIGRQIGDVLLVNDDQVERQHAWITKEDNSWVLYDADTPGGTFLNGERITREEILPGDVIRVGTTTLEFRGAGGHAGAFKDESRSVAGEAESSVVERAKRRVRPATLALGVSIAVAVAGLVVLGIVIPLRYWKSLDSVTEERWKAAMDRLGSSVAGDTEWVTAAAEIVDNWLANPLPESSSLNAPWWVVGSARMNREAGYRLGLFALAQRFLEQASRAPVSGDPPVLDSVAISDAYPKVAALEVTIANLTPPPGVSDIWQGRRNQLLAMVRSWLAAASNAEASGTAAVGYSSERRQALDYLLTGWYTYQQAGQRIEILGRAFDQFQLCRQTLTTVLSARPGDPDASAVRGLAGFLAANVLYDAGSPQATERWERALEALESAEGDLANTNSQIWDRAIPSDLLGRFPSPASVRAQLNALRTVITSSLQEAAEGQTSEGAGGGSGESSGLTER